MPRKPSYDELESRVLALENEVSTRRKAEAAFRESEEIYRATFEQAAIGIVQVTMDGRFNRVNQRFCDIVGYNKEELTTKGYQDITHPEDLRESVNRIDQLLKNSYCKGRVSKTICPQGRGRRLGEHAAFSPAGFRGEPRMHYRRDRRHHNLERSRKSADQQ